MIRTTLHRPAERGGRGGNCPGARRVLGARPGPAINFENIMISYKKYIIYASLKYNLTELNYNPIKLQASEYYRTYLPFDHFYVVLSLICILYNNKNGIKYYTIKP